MKAQVCEHLENLLTLALDNGCTITGIEEGWSETKRVIYLSPQMPSILKQAINTVKLPIEYYIYAGSPHNKPDEGFICNSCRIGISFYLQCPKSQNTHE